jgi:hypothetical protein
MNSHTRKAEPSALATLITEHLDLVMRPEFVVLLSLPKTLFKLTRGLRRNQNIIAA